MTIQDMIKKASEVMTLSAQAFKDRGAKVYTAEMHAACAGKAMAVALLVGTDETPTVATPQAYAALFHALHNHSAWRQRHEKAKIFEVATKRASSLDGLMAELEEEGV